LLRPLLVSQVLPAPPLSRPSGASGPPLAGLALGEGHIYLGGPVSASTPVLGGQGHPSPQQPATGEAHLSPARLPSPSPPAPPSNHSISST
jgi:hypothetical protein